MVLAKSSERARKKNSKKKKGSVKLNAEKAFPYCETKC